MEAKYICVYFVFALLVPPLANDRVLSSISLGSVALVSVVQAHDRITDSLNIGI